jgi:hypothetical protein
MHTAKSLKEKITSYFHTTKKTSKNKCFSMHFGFNNQFIKVTITWPIFQKFQKNYVVFLISGIMNLYVKRTPDIKKVVFFYRH